MSVRRDIDAYLNTLCWAMGGSFAEQQAVRDELRTHIDAAVRERAMQGMREADAVRETLHDLGEPEALGRAMRASRGTPALRRPLVQPEGAVLIGHHRARALPDARLLFALGAWSIAAAAAALIYAWPK